MISINVFEVHIFTAMNRVYFIRLLWRTGLKVIKKNACSTESEIILLINVKMPPVGILTYISMIRTSISLRVLKA